MKIEIGGKAPDFRLFNSEKKEVGLNDFEGKKRVLLFFPLAFSDVCTEELCSIRDKMADYNELEAEVIGISVDSVFTLEKFKEVNGYDFALLSDFNREVSEKYGALHEDFAFGMKGVSKRSVFVLDEDGKVLHKEILDNPGEMPDLKKVKEVLSEN